MAQSVWREVWRQIRFVLGDWLVSLAIAAYPASSDEQIALCRLIVEYPANHDVRE